MVLLFMLGCCLRLVKQCKINNSFSKIYFKFNFIRLLFVCGSFCQTDQKLHSTCIKFHSLIEKNQLRCLVRALLIAFVYLILGSV